MDVVGAMSVRQLLRRGVVDLGQDEGGERGGLRRGRGGALGEDCAVVRYAGAEGGLVVSLMADRGTEDGSLEHTRAGE